ncbi:hypothetical protein CEXT_551841 [Caerostris extrusa]|uniref:Uncharacterized protein n=1 Tax=Caerostris extrusa TaxID=172846 RepID=A0AAV4XDM3_CAEEX|nr:hypothetical protein CEXT_551841 [Caerostris extrusa]
MADGKKKERIQLFPKVKLLVITKVYLRNERSGINVHNGIFLVPVLPRKKPFPRKALRDGEWGIKLGIRSSLERKMFGMEKRKHLFPSSGKRIPLMLVVIGVEGGGDVPGHRDKRD